MSQNAIFHQCYWIINIFGAWEIQLYFSQCRHAYADEAVSLFKKDACLCSQKEVSRRNKLRKAKENWIIWKRLLVSQINEG